MLFENVPKGVIPAHDHCFHNRKELEASQICGCCYCLSIFKPNEIHEWLDHEAPGTAFCPKCSIDAVIGDKSGFPITEKFLKQMNEHWFK
jgi:hypothetical protein